MDGLAGPALHACCLSLLKVTADKQTVPQAHIISLSPAKNMVQHDCAGERQLQRRVFCSLTSLTPLLPRGAMTPQA